MASNPNSLRPLPHLCHPPPASPPPSPSAAFFRPTPPSPLRRPRYEKFASEYTAVEEYVKQCKPEDPSFLPDFDMSDLGVVVNSVEEVKTASTESASNTKTLEASEKLPSANSIESAVPGGDPPESVMMFKSGENKGSALMARILRDKEQVGISTRTFVHAHHVYQLVVIPFVLRNSLH